MSFKDHFSGHASSYAQHRPTYPQALYDFILSHCEERALAWDCATGSGQAAVALANYFEKVIATDASKEQIDSAQRTENIDYRVMPAEHSGMNTGSVDLITVAQALHWFHFETFFAEVHRVLKHTGLLAVWTYGRTKINSEIDEIVETFYTQTVGPYWPPERDHIEANYNSIPFPLETIECPTFEMEKEWTLSEFLGYLSTWSATRRFIADKGYNPILDLEKVLKDIWPAPFTVRWPILLKIGSLRKLKY